MLQRLFDEGQSSRFVLRLRDVGLKHLAFVIDRSPEVVHLLADFYVNLVVGRLGATRHASLLDRRSYLQVHFT